MQIVIDIPNSIYANLPKIVNGSIASKRILDCVKNGTPLPKGHGDLVDRNDLKYEKYNSYAYAIANADTIIEADKAESEVK